MRLPPAQLRAAALAMSPSWCVFPDPDDGPSIRTLRALKRRGWLEPDDPDDPEGEWSWTDAGWAAVAPAPTPAPGDAVAALGLALKALVGDATGLYRSADVPRQWFTSDDVAHDFSDALAVLDVAERWRRTRCPAPWTRPTRRCSCSSARRPARRSPGGASPSR